MWMYLNLCDFMWNYVSQKNVIWMSMHLHKYEFDVIFKLSKKFIECGTNLHKYSHIFN
jgi:hypothetical protein